MKVKIIRTVEAGETFVNADNDETFSYAGNEPDPIRLITKGSPAPKGKLVDTGHLRSILYSPSSAEHKVQRLAPLVQCTEQETAELLHQGNEAVVDFFERLQIGERLFEWVEKDEHRKASLRLWLFRNKLVAVDGWEAASREEIVTQVKHRVLSEEKNFQNMRREIELFEKLSQLPPQRNRERIPEDVRMFVWRRDEGRCVKCGSREKTEFDHIIPLTHGGSNTARNIELLCERCNRQKGSRI